jgi:hypothetical protein
MSGWDELEEATPQDKEPGVIDLDLLVAKTFGNDEGLKVLAWMREFYLERPCWQPGADASLGQYREGQNSVIRDIELRIKKARSK